MLFFHKAKDNFEIKQKTNKQTNKTKKKNVTTNKQNAKFW